MCEGENFKLNFSLSGQKNVKFFPIRRKKVKRSNPPLWKLKMPKVGAWTLRHYLSRKKMALFQFTRPIDFYPSNPSFTRPIKFLRVQWQNRYIKTFLRLQSILSVQSKKNKIFLKIFNFRFWFRISVFGF
jgi:hypothetical protein